MLTAIKHVADDNFIFNRTSLWHIVRATVKLHDSKLSTTHLLITAFILTAQQ